MYVYLCACRQMFFRFARVYALQLPPGLPFDLALFGSGQFATFWRIKQFTLARHMRRQIVTTTTATTTATAVTTTTSVATTTTSIASTWYDGEYLLPLLNIAGCCCCCCKYLMHSVRQNVPHYGSPHFCFCFSSCYFFRRLLPVFNVRRGRWLSRSPVAHTAFANAACHRGAYA